MAAPPESRDPNTISMIVEKWEEGQEEQFSLYHRIHGYPWRLRVYKEFFDWQERTDHRHVSVICEKSREATLWKCTATINKARTFTFTSWGLHSREHLLTHDEFPPGSKVQIQISATIEDGKSWNHYPVANGANDGILVFGKDERKIHVNKKSLAAQSPYFEQLFFGGYIEKDMKEIPIEGVEYEEFLNIIKLIYRSGGATLTDGNLHAVLHIADRFGIKLITDLVVSYLLSSASSLSLLQKILISDDYNLPLEFILEHMDRWASGGTTIEQIIATTEFKQFSKGTLRVLFKRLCHSTVGVSRKWIWDKADSSDTDEYVKISMVVDKNPERNLILSYAHSVNGIDWRLQLYRNTLSLICDKSAASKLWRCTATISSPRFSYITPLRFETFTHTFTGKKRRETRICDIELPKFGDFLAIELTTKRTKKRCSLLPQPLDGSIVIGEEKKTIRVNRKSLASQSPFFQRLFFGESKEENVDEITVGDVEYQELSNIINLACNFDGASMTDENMRRVLELARRFEIKIVEERVISYLVSSACALSLLSKLSIAEQCNRPFLMDILLSPSFTKSMLLEMVESPEWNQLSFETIRVLFNKFCV